MDDVLYLLVVICCSFSLVGSAVVIIVYAVSQNLKKLGSQFVFCQSLCDLLLSVYVNSSKYFSFSNVSFIFLLLLEQY